MTEQTSSTVGRRGGPPTARAASKREKILEAAMEHFARHGYGVSRVEDIAARLSISKASVFQYFASKADLFLDVYKKVTPSLGRYLDAPPEARQQGFFAVVRYWLEALPEHARKNEIAWKIHLVGYHGTERSVRLAVRRYVAAEDPGGVAEFIRWGIQKGELRDDIDPSVLGCTVEWLVERFLDGMIDETLHPELFDAARLAPRDHQRRIDDFMTLLKSALGRK